MSTITVVSKRCDWCHKESSPIDMKTHDTPDGWHWNQILANGPIVDFCCSEHQELWLEKYTRRNAKGIVTNLTPAWISDYGH